jgi:hypothetical protein
MHRLLCAALLLYLVGDFANPILGAVTLEDTLQATPASRAPGDRLVAIPTPLPPGGATAAVVTVTPPAVPRVRPRAVPLLHRPRAHTAPTTAEPGDHH